MIGYASGIMDVLSVQDTELTFVIEIIQPRCYDGKGMVRGWKVNGAELRGRINQLNLATHEALGPEPSIHAGAQCRHCLARVICPAHQQLGMDAADYAQSAVPVQITDAALAYEWIVVQRALGSLKYRAEALESEALARIAKGKQIPGISQKQSLGHAKWIADDATVIGMGDAMGLNFRAPEKPLTPTKVKEMLKEQNLQPSVIDGLHQRPLGSVSIEIDDTAVIRSRFTDEVYYD